jgi:hypothetical protein
LTPIPIRSPLESPSLPSDSLRGRVEHQVDIIAESANKVITGVVDTSFGVLRSILPIGSPDPNISPEDPNSTSAPWNNMRPGFGLLRRESGFTIAGITASLPGRAKSVPAGEESGRQLITVNSRPSSIKSGYAGNETYAEEDEGGYSDDAEGAEAEIEDGDDVGGEAGHDARSIRSFESMMSGKSKNRRGAGSRKSLTDRLAHMSGLSRLGPQDTQKVHVFVK